MGPKSDKRNRKPWRPDKRNRDPWRQSPPWTYQTLTKLKDDVKHVTPPSSCNVRHPNVLLVGPVGAGKSSFFNSVSSTFQGMPSQQALSGSSDTSITSKFRPYKVRDGVTNEELKFRLCDTRGLEVRLDNKDEFQLILDGNIKDGYEHGTANTRPYLWTMLFAYLKGLVLKHFQTPKEPRGYQAKATMADKMHCVCFVLDGSTVSTLEGSWLVERLTTLQKICDENGVPYVIMLTKMDQVCAEVNRHVSSVFHSDTVRQVVDETVRLFGVEEKHILPVKNYENEADILTDVSILTLLALKRMLGRAKDYLMNKYDYEQDDGKNAESFIVNMGNDNA